MRSIMQIKNECWKDIAGYEGLYEISSHGRVRRNNLILHNNYNSYGYLHVSLCKNGIIKTIPIHTLVAKAFIKNPKNYVEINHIDGNKTNNYFENLEWCSRLYNNIHAIKTGLRKTKPLSMYKNGLKIKTFNNRLEIEDYFHRKVCQDLITRVCNGQRKSAYGYWWKYE